MCVSQLLVNGEEYDIGIVVTTNSNIIVVMVLGMLAAIGVGAALAYVAVARERKKRKCKCILSKLITFFQNRNDFYDVVKIFCNYYTLYKYFKCMENICFLLFLTII